MGFDFISGKELAEKFENQFLHEHYLEHKIDEVIEIKGVDKVESVIIQSLDKSATKETPCRGVFIQIGYLPNTEFFQDLVKLNEKGEIVINPDCSTNVEGIFACDDVTNCFGKRIIIASGEGAKACLSAKEYLLQMGIK